MQGKNHKVGSSSSEVRRYIDEIFRNTTLNETKYMLYVCMHACMHVIIYTYTYMQTLLLQLRQPPPFPHTPPAQASPKKKDKMC